MASAADSIATLQRFVNEYAKDVQLAKDALGRIQPEAAQRVLIGVLNYGLDMLDIFPDHYQGLGMADDAVILRLGAKLAVAAGAKDAGLDRLAAEVDLVRDAFGSLLEPFKALVARLPDRVVHGRDASRILGSKDVRAMFEADVARQVKSYRPQTIEIASGGPARALDELKGMLRHALKKVGIDPS
jgi:uncharacterized membrane protein YkvA (DUF1232 family)